MNLEDAQDEKIAEINAEFHSEGKDLELTNTEFKAMSAICNGTESDNIPDDIKALAAQIYLGTAVENSLKSKETPKETKEALENGRFEHIPGHTIKEAFSGLYNDEPDVKYFLCAVFDALAKIAQENKTKEEALKIAKDLPRLQSIRPQRHTMPNTMLANELQRGGIIDAGEQVLAVLGTGKRAKSNGEIITTSVIATYQQGDDITVKGNYTEYDRQVQDAFCSLYEYGDKSHIVTVPMIYRAMTASSIDPSPQQAGAITRSIEKQRRINVVIDASKELERRGVTDENGNPVKFKYDDFLLSLKGIEVTAGGKKVKAYQMKDPPLLLTYSKLTKQLLTVKSDYLDIKEVTTKGNITKNSLRNTESRISIKGYLIRRIEVLRHDIEQATDNLRRYEARRKKDPTLPEKAVSDFRQQTNRILFETLFDETGQTTSNRAQTKDNRDFALQCLDYWKAIGTIKGYTIVKGNKNSMRGVDLLL